MKGTQKTVAAIYTGLGLVEPGKQAFAELLPDVRAISILDESLIADVIRDGYMTKSVLRRLYQCCCSAVEMGADVILETCSSVGESVDLLQPFFDIPIIRIDEAMIREAIKVEGTIGVIATLPTTLEPTCRFAERLAKEAGLSIEVQQGLAAGAFEAICNGNKATHDALILQQAKSMNECKSFLLAQGSMAHMEKPLAEVTSKPVFTSLRRGIEAVKAYL